MLASLAVFAVCGLTVQQASPDVPPQPRLLDPPTLAAFLRARDAAGGADAWADGAVLTVGLEAPDVDAVELTGSLAGLACSRLDGSDWWVARVEIEGLDRAAFGFDFARTRGDESLDSGVWAGRPFRGPLASPPPARAEPLQGRVFTHFIDSSPMGEGRGLDVYTPPGHDADAENPVLYMTDGQGVDEVATVIEPLIVDGVIPPLVIVGMHSSSGRLRQYEYVPRFAPERGPEVDRFERYVEFFLDEVMVWAEEALGASADPDLRGLYGTSNGADFGVSFSLRHPEEVGHVFALSKGISEAIPEVWSTAERVPAFHLTAGTFESGFWVATTGWKKALEAAGHEPTYVEAVRGHDYSMWSEELAMLLPRMFVVEGR